MKRLMQYATLMCAFCGALSSATAPAGWGELFSDNFEDGTLRKWKFQADPAAQQPSWSVELDGDNHVMAGRGHIFAIAIPVRGSDYRFKARVKLIRGNLQMNVRDTCERYDVNFGGNRIVLTRTMPCMQHTQIQTVNRALQMNTWYVFEVVANGNEVSVLVDGESVLSFSDSGTPVTFGEVNFEALDNTYAQVDDVEVSGPPRGEGDLQIVDFVLPRTAPGVPYEHRLTATGGTPPYRWSVPQPRYSPPGMSLSVDGVLSGKAPAAGRLYPALFVVTDSAGNQAMEALEFTADDQMLTTPRLLPAGEAGKEYRVALEGIGLADGCFWVGLSLPPGLALNAQTGVLSGTPVLGGVYNFLAVCIDASMEGPDRIFTVHISEPDPAPLALVTRPEELGDISMAEGTPYTYVRANGGVPPYSWAVIGGSLPPGTRLASGKALPEDLGALAAAIGGMPRSIGEYRFTLEVTDAAGAKAVQDFSVRTSMLQIDDEGDEVGILGAPYEMRLRATNAAGQARWTPILLPAGLDLTADGVLKGSPTECGLLSLVAEVTDSGSPPSTLRTGGEAGVAVLCRLDPLAQLDISIPPAVRAKAGEPFTLRFGISNGTGTGYSLAIDSGALAPGLTLTGGGAPGLYVVSGAPAAAGTFDCFLRATDSAGNFGLRRLRVVVE